MIYNVRHVTEVHYAAPVKLARFNLRLQPAEWPGQMLLDYDLQVSPQAARIATDTGPFIVNNSRLAIGKPISQLRVESTFTVQIDCHPVLDLEGAPSVDEVRLAALDSRGLSGSDPAPYLFASLVAKLDPEIGSWGARHLPGTAGIVDAAKALMHALNDEFTYDNKATTVETPPITAFRTRRGVCQDFAHIMIIALRSAGIPAAYVSGYLRTVPAPGKARLVGVDATHAWVNVWCGSRIGWIGLDPTNDIEVGSDHIFTAMGRDYADVAPIDGVFIGGAGQKSKVWVDVEAVGG